MKTITRRKTITYIAFSVIATAIFLLLYISYLLLAPAKILDVKEPLPVSPTRVEAGAVVNLKLNYCKYKNADSHITIDFIGDAVIPSLSTTRQFPVGCHNRVLPISVPASTPDGQYKIHLTIVYQVNPLHEETYSFDSIVLEVYNNENKATVTPNVQ
jgi:hypothetical protein